MDFSQFGPEKPPDDLDAWCDANWAKVPDEARLRCLVHLRSKVPAYIVEGWRAQHERGMRIGSDDLMFHLGVGMSVRNCLRGVMLDDELPAVLQSNGESHSNWDDYYTGALRELVSGK